MKKLLILILIALALSGKGNDKYLFTDTKTDLNGNLTADPVTWIFDTEKQTITLFTEREDVVINYIKDTTIYSAEDAMTFDKYIISDNSSIIYVDKETLQIVYIIDKKQFIFRP